MLDAPDAGAHGGPRSVVTVGVCRHGDAGDRGRLDDRAKLGLRVELLARIGVGEAGPLGRVGLDEVHAV